MNGNDDFGNTNDFHGGWFVETGASDVQRLVAPAFDSFKGVERVFLAGDSVGDSHSSRFDLTAVDAQNSDAGASDTIMDSVVGILPFAPFKILKVCILVQLAPMTI